MIHGEAECNTARRVAGSIPDEVIGFFFLIDLIRPAALWPSGVDSASNRSEYQKTSCE
jgi:hypothetical protein